MIKLVSHDSMVCAVVDDINNALEAHFDTNIMCGIGAKKFGERKQIIEKRNDHANAIIFCINRRYNEVKVHKTNFHKDNQEDV